MRLFVLVSDEMSFTQAARSLDVTTGAASRIISELEHHLATRLLHRTTRHLSLTPAGKRYLGRCRALIAALDEAEAEARAVHLQPAGRLRVHASTTLGRHYLVPAIREYQRMHSSVHVSLTLSDTASNWLDEGFDTALVAARALRDSSLVAVHLGDTYSVLCAAPSYLHAHAPIYSPADLEHHAFASFDIDATEGIELALIGSEGTTSAIVHPAFSVNSGESILSALEYGMGIGALPLHRVVDALGTGRLKRVLPDHHLQPLNIYALFPSRQFLDAKVRTWLDHLKLHFGKAAERDRTVLAALAA